MMETPLNAWLLFDHSPHHAPEAELVSRTPSGERGAARPTPSSAAAPSSSCTPSTTWASSRGTGWPRWPGTAPVTSRRTSGCPAPGGCCTPSTSGCRPRSWPTCSSDADDRAVLVDPDLLPLLEQALDHVPAPGHVIVLGDHVPDTSSPGVIAYEDLMADEPTEYPRRDDRRARAHGALLHVGDHRTAQGRRLHPSLHVPPRPGRHLPRRHVDRAGRRRTPPGADVPRQRLGHALRGGRGRGQAGLLRRCPRSRRTSSTCWWRSG